MPRRPARPPEKKEPASIPSTSRAKSAPAAKSPATLKPPKFQLPRYIAVEGPIRVGKSSLARILAERMHARRILDCDEDNPFLTDFYAEREGSALAAQMYFLHERYERLTEAFSAERPSPIVADFIFE